MLRSPAVLLVLGLSALALAACAPARPRWQQAGVPAAQVERDWNDCRRQADEQSDPGRGGGVGFGVGSGGGSPTAEADRQRAASQVRQIRDACMRARGYQPGAAR